LPRIASDGVVAQILAIFCGAVGVERGRHVHGQDLVEARSEYFLGIAQVTHHFRGSPVLRIGSV
jgi:hypothetical protein